MKQLNIEQIKARQLDILIAVDKFCRENKIKYSLAYGTLIGAIRHKGYIPWDDDIDIMMPRTDYEKFIRIFTAEYYRVYSYENCEDYNYTFAKVSDERTILKEFSTMKNTFGVNIDVFPIDNLPDRGQECKRLVSLNVFLRGLLVLKVVKVCRNRSFLKNMILFVSQLILKLVSYKFLVRKIDQNARRWEQSKTTRMGCVIGIDAAKECFPASTYDEYIDVDFELKSFRSIKDYDTNLSALYGDYMTPPPANQQETHHAFEAFEK